MGVGKEVEGAVGPSLDFEIDISLLNV